MSETAHIQLKAKISDLEAESAYKLGVYIGSQIAAKEILIGTVMSSSSHELVKALFQGLREQDKQPSYVEDVSTDMLVFALNRYNYKVGVILINDNSANTNIFAAHIYSISDIKIDEATIAESFKSTKEYIANNSALPSGVQINIEDDFIEYSKRTINSSLWPSLKVIVDAGNGVGEKSILQVLRTIPQLNIVPLHSSISDNYPHHYPNPDLSINTVELQEQVLQAKADLGISIGVEGTRVKFIDTAGQIIGSQYLTSLLITKFLQQYPNRSIVFENGYQRMWKDVVTKSQGIAVKHNILTTATNDIMASSLAIFGTDGQDNYYFASNNYHASGIQTVLHLLELLALRKQSIGQLIAPYVLQYHTSNRIDLSLLPGHGLDEVMHKLIDKYNSAAINTEAQSIEIASGSWRIYLRRSTHDASNTKLRLFIEAYSSDNIESIKREVLSVLESTVKLFDENAGILGSELVDLKPREQLEKLLENFYYSWNRHTHSPTHPLYNVNWMHNPTPTKLIKGMSEEDFANYWSANANWVYLNLRQLSLYKDDSTYFQRISAIHTKIAKLSAHPVAYFSLEFALADWLQIYSGGLGVLAGDVLKQASDTGLPMVGVGIFYHQGYFHQHIDQEGNQQEEYITQDIKDYPFEPARTPAGEVAETTIWITDHEVYVRGWIANVGRQKLILLDTNYDKNSQADDRMISAHLYGGNQDTRVRQEILLGMGGYQLLLQMGIEPGICHMNEGHSAFVSMSMAHKLMQEKGLDFKAALAQAKQKLVFTNHTLKAAGNDSFPYELMKQYFAIYAEKMQIPFEQIFEMGIAEPMTRGHFSMTIAGMNYAAKVNAVSKIHSKAAENIWPGHQLIPITNGVHMPTWVARPIHQLLDIHVSERWHDPRVNVDYSQVYNIPNSKLWQVHQSLKETLLTSINKELGLELKTDILLLSWFRRFTAYKRPELIISNMDRLLEILKSDTCPIQILIGGKAHPQDGEGKGLMKEVYQALNRPEFKNKVVFIPGYNWRLAKLLVAGSDVWVNTPRRYEEACGTSGMKAGANGVLQLTTLDGWTDEVDWADKGWVVPDQDPNTLFNMIQNKVIPTYYQYDETGLPNAWVKRMLNTMQIVLSQYSTERQLSDYIRQLYLPVLETE